MQKKYNVIIIGGGVSGLSLGAVFGKMGYKCCILEKEHQAGGYIAGYSRKDFHFDTAIHWLNQFGETGIVHKLFSFIGNDYPKPVPLKQIHRYKSKNYDIMLQSDINKVKADFISQFPDEEVGINLFFKHSCELAKISNNISNFSRSHETMGLVEKSIYYTRMLPYIIPLIKHLKYSGDIGMQKAMDKYFIGEKIKDVFNSESDLLSCLFPLAWAENNDYYKTPAGGSVRYVDWLLRKNNDLGNTILLNAEAKAIIVESKTAKGVDFLMNNQKESIYADYVVMAADLPSLYRKMLPPELLDKQRIAKLEKAVLYKSSFTVSVALSCKAEQLGFGEELISLAQNNMERAGHESSDPEISKLSIIAPSARDKTICPKGKGIITIYMAADIEKYDYWKTELSPQGTRLRGKAYREFKNKIARQLIDRVERELAPDLKKNILFYEVATPFTYQRYTYNYKGSMMGQRPGKENMQNKVASHYTQIKNLLIGGQWAELGGGIPTAARSALNTALIVLRKEDKTKYKLLSHFFDGKIDLDTLNTKLL